MKKKGIEPKAGTTNTQRQMKKAALPVKNRRFYWMPASCMILAFIVYSPVFNADFVNWDDEAYVLNNYAITSFGYLKDIVTQPVQGNYHPLTMLTLAANYAVSGYNAGSYHIVNLLIHLLNILLVFLFIRKLTGDKPWLAFIVALLFAVHPLHVESVAWVSERKDVLYSLFFLAGLLLYLRYSATRKIKDYLFVFLLFVLSLLSKPAAVVFPIVLLAIDYYHGRLKEKRTWYEKVPFFILSLIVGLMTMHAQKLQGSVGTAEIPNEYFRIFYASYGIMMYIVKAAWPFSLCAFYAFPPANASLPPEYYVSLLTGIALIALLIFAFRRHRLLAFAILFYLVNLLLVLQFFPVGSAVIADRYAYLPLIGVFLVPAWYFQEWIDAHNGKLPVIGLSVLVFVAVMLSILTFRQSATWKNSASLWDHAIHVAPGSMAYTNRGIIFYQENNYPEALEMFNKAIDLNTEELDARNNRGSIYYNSKQYELALADFNASLAIDSTNEMACLNRGSVYAALGNFDLALADMNRAIRLNPGTMHGYFNRGLLNQMMNRNDEAIADFTRQMEVNHQRPPEILNSLALVYIKQDEYDKALDLLSQAIAVEEKGSYFLNRAVVYSRLGRKPEALADALRAESMGMQVNKDFMKSLEQ